MFDRLHLHEGGRTTVNNTFKMLPHDTADAARLYGEVREKASEELAGAVAVDLGADNEVRVVRADAMRVWDPAKGPNTQMRIIYKINGRLHDVVLEVDEMVLLRNVHENIARAMFEQLVDKLSAEAKSALFPRKLS